MHLLSSVGIGTAPTGRAGPRSVLIGGETLLVECAEILLRHRHEIVAVAAPAGVAADWAQRTGLRHFTRLRDLRDADLGEIDYLFSIANLSVLPGDLLALARRAAINFHDGPLPDYAGLNTPAWALMAGEKSHGVTWHLMTEAVDCGDILASESIAIDPAESALSLNTKCFEAGIRTFADLVAHLDAGGPRRVSQPGPAKRWFSRGDRPPVAATIDWNAPAEAIMRLVAALDFGAYRNPLGAPKALAGDTLFLVQQVEMLDSRSDLPPGTVIAGGPMPLVATGTNDLRLTRITDLAGQPIEQLPAPSGGRLALLEESQRGTLESLDAAAGLYENWWRARLAARDPLCLPQFRSAAIRDARIEIDCIFDGDRSAKKMLSAIVAYLGRVADRDIVEIGYADQVYVSRLDGVHAWFADQLPLRIALDWDQPLAALEQQIAVETGEMHRRIGIAADLVARSPDLRAGLPFAHPVCVQIVDRLDDARISGETILTIAIASDGGTCRWSYDPARLDPAALDDLQRGFRALLDAEDAAPDTPIARLSLLAESERRTVLTDWNAATAPVPEVTGIHQLFAEQARRTPDRIAATARDVSISYAELAARSNRLARHLSQIGVGPEMLVGIHLERSLDMLVALLAIHQAGGAYVPLDPSYPAGRLAHMIADSGLAVVVTQRSLADSLPETGARVVRLDTERAAIDALSSEPFDGGAGAENLAYVIYTSGSTGRPKGVMVEHRNLLNFFAGMDRTLEPDGTWLAVTSPSFDISVLELYWPLTRGYHVVIATEREVRGDVRPHAAAGTLDFSLFYFASADSASNADQYRLLLEGAKFADDNGFEAVWTPERHFHAFGGLYPNPSVISAAIAVSTSRVKIRAGSCVAPLHHPARIAEEWSLVDNLSNGRTGIAFASGWQPDDFLLRPENFEDRNGALLRSIADVRALWRGEKRSFPGPFGKPVEVGIFPRPVQPELPFWITSAGNPETFAAAGRAGAFVLTHLLGQSVAEVAAKLDVYRRAWREAGHPGDGHVTMMLHSFVGTDAEAVRAIVRGPLIEYLRTSTSLLKQYAWSFPAFKRPAGSDASDQPDLAGLSPEETEALLEHAFDRYFETSGLFGTPEDCVDLIRQLQAVGVNEIGCLIDFGIPTATVLEHLPFLNQLRQLATTPDEGHETSLAELIARHHVTHLQCTPSLLQMLAADDAAREGLASLRRLMVGGEAFPPRLAHDMTALVGGVVTNMYGPTETTIWSAVHELGDEQGAPPLGRPLANQQVYILDRRLEPVRPGTPGELIIGGDGVVRGYLGRPELTAERFVADPFAAGRRVYRTGDIARQRDDGTIDFLGRIDNQIKIRGYRVELGEIEAALLRHADVREAVVVPRESDGVACLVAYYAGTPGLDRKIDELRRQLREMLPDFMVPAHFVRLDALPRTPNGKIDRMALPEPSSSDPAEADDVVVTAGSPLQQQILAIWRDVLKLRRVGLRDNFFDIGGHSLLAVQAHRRLSAVVGQPLSLTDIFRFPTVEALSAYLGGAGSPAKSDGAGSDRARHRRLALQRRAGVPAMARN
jgi:natural product biosynthesis luciferase-like monooxygenase protein